MRHILSSLLMAFAEAKQFVQNKQEAPKWQSSKQSDGGAGGVWGDCPSLPSPFPDRSQHWGGSRPASG